VILDLLYPPKCLYCETALKCNRPFCSACQELFTLLDQEGHCSKCFAEITTPSGICRPCREIAHPFARLCTCFDAFGPAQSLVNGLTKQHQFHFAKDIAALLLIQIERLGFPPFDLITIVPKYFRRRDQILAKELSVSLSIPFKLILRRELKPIPIFSLRKKCNIINQKVLLLDISMETRTTIRSAGWALQQSGAETIYGMTFCAT